MSRTNSNGTPPPPPKPFDDLQDCIACVEDNIRTLLWNHSLATHKIVMTKNSIQTMLWDQIGNAEANRAADYLHRKTNLEANLSWAHDFLVGMLQSGVRPYLHQAKETMADAEQEVKEEEGKVLDEAVYFPLLLDYFNRAVDVIQKEKDHYYFIVDSARQELDILFHFFDDEDDTVYDDDDDLGASKEPIVKLSTHIKEKLKTLVAAANKSLTLGGSASSPIKAMLRLLFDYINDELIVVYSDQQLTSLMKQLKAYISAYSATGLSYHRK